MTNTICCHCVSAVSYSSLLIMANALILETQVHTQMVQYNENYAWKRIRSMVTLWTGLSHWGLDVMVLV